MKDEDIYLEELNDLDQVGIQYMDESYDAYNSEELNGNDE